MKVKTKTNVHVGDIIYHITGYKVKVLEIKESGAYPIKVSLPNSEIMYISIATNEHNINEWLLISPKRSNVNAAYYISRPIIAMDTIINVYDYNKMKWVKRYFAGFNDDGECLIWRGGSSSITTAHEPVKAGMWALDEDLEKVKAQQAERRSK